MTPITQSWKGTIIQHAAALAKRKFTLNDLDVIPAPYHEPTPTKRFVILKGKLPNYVDQQIVHFAPYDAQKYFFDIPIAVNATSPMTGEGIIDYLSTTFGVVFDKEIDFSESFLTTVFSPSGVSTLVTIPFADTSIIWKGSFDVVMVNEGFSLDHVANRALEALIYPDVTMPNTMSLRLLSTPYIVVDDQIKHALKDGATVTITPDLAQLIATDMVNEYYLPAEWVGGFVSMISGQVLTMTDVVGNDTYNRKGELTTPVASEHLSGIFVIKFWNTGQMPICPSVGSPIMVADLEPLGYNDKVGLTKLAVGTITTDMFNSILSYQRQLHPELTYIDDIVESIGRDEVKFGNSTQTVGVLTSTITQNMQPDSMWTGSFNVVVPVTDFVIQTERGLKIKTEDGRDVLMEGKIIHITKGAGPLNVDFGWIQNLRFDEIPYVSKILFSGVNEDGTFILSPTLVTEDAADGTHYTNVTSPGVTIKVK